MAPKRKKSLNLNIRKNELVERVQLAPNNLTVVELRVELGKLGLARSGLKKELVERLKAANSTPPPSVENPPRPALPNPKQTVHIMKGPDGKLIQVVGLLPGQQLVQMQDGNFRVFAAKIIATGPPMPSPQYAPTPNQPTNYNSVLNPQGYNSRLPRPVPLNWPLMNRQYANYNHIDRYEDDDTCFFEDNEE